jgi:hypothetical protein
MPSPTGRLTHSVSSTGSSIAFPCLFDERMPPANSRSLRILPSTSASSLLRKPCVFSCVSSPMTKYASCWRAHGPQKATPRISTSALRGQGFPVLLRTWQWPGFAIASVKETAIRKALDRFFEDVARAEGGNLLGRDLHLLAGLGIPALPSLTLLDGELPEACDLDLLTALSVSVTTRSRASKCLISYR